jgi:hypothetical protein
MGLELKLHPDCTCRAVARIEAEVERRADALSLRYVVTGAVAAIELAPAAAPARTDELWRTTCFEAFISEAGGGYSEFNFAPSTQWAAYHFDGYRAGMRNIPAEPAIQVIHQEGRFELRASVSLSANADRLALSAVIEETDGNKSYWALAHPPGKPDFHHADSFAYELG